MQLKHWEWISDYYMCSLGDVYRAALPSAFLLESETIVFKNPDFEDDSVLTDDEFLVFDSLKTVKKIGYYQKVISLFMRE